MADNDTHKLSKTQEALLCLLKEIDTICRKYDIVYYLIGGSALGAVRHHGFIPWDDDADIVMDHPNYMKFVKAMSIEPLPANRNYSDPFLPPYTHTNIFGRYSSTDTTCIFDGVAYQPDNCNGVKVDVFQLLPCPDAGPERDAYLARFREWAELCHPTARNKETDPERYRELSQLGNQMGLGKLRLELFEAINIDAYQNCAQYLYGYEKFHFFYDKDIFQEPIYLPFVDTELPVPTRYQKHFRTLFGDDWYCIPDSEGQITHRTCLDLNRGYKYYSSDYMRFKREDDFMVKQEYKYRVMRYWESQREVDALNARIKSKLLKRKYDLLWSRISNDIEELFGEGQYGRILELLEGYIADQTGSLAQVANMFIEVDPRMYVTACYSALALSKIKTCRRMLAPRPDYYTSTAISDVQRYLASKDRLFALIETGSPLEELLTLVENGLSEHPNDRDFHYWKAHILIDLKQSESKADLPIELIKAILDSYEDDGDFVALRGRLYELAGNKSAAIQQYRKAITLTNNGLVQLNARVRLAELEDKG